MKTPEEIKRLLANHRDYTFNLQELLTDALTLIEQLERERDAAVKDIPHTCKYCANESQKWLKEEYPRMNDICCTCIGNDMCNWKWRGVQEVE